MPPSSPMLSRAIIASAVATVYVQGDQTCFVRQQYGEGESRCIIFPALRPPYVHPQLQLRGERSLNYILSGLIAVLK